MKYTKELLGPIVLQCSSVAGVLRRLGVKQAGGTHAHISRLIRQYALDTTHFLGRASNCGANHVGGYTKRTAENTLVLRQSGTREHAPILRRALLAAGVAYRCSVCNSPPCWQGKPLVLQVDHMNGNWLDDRRANLRFLCPNCHSQTAGWCRKVKRA